MQRSRRRKSPVGGGIRGEEVIDEGKCRISAELDELWNKVEIIRGLEDEVEELKEMLEVERRNNVLADTNEGLMENRGNTVTEERFDRIANFPADTIRCSRGRPVDTLIALSRNI